MRGKGGGSLRLGQHNWPGWPLLGRPRLSSMRQWTCPLFWLLEPPTVCAHRWGDRESTSESPGSTRSPPCPVVQWWLGPWWLSASGPMQHGTLVPCVLAQGSCALGRGTVSQQQAL